MDDKDTHLRDNHQVYGTTIWDNATCRQCETIEQELKKVKVQLLIVEADFQKAKTEIELEKTKVRWEMERKLSRKVSTRLPKDVSMFIQSLEKDVIDAKDTIRRLKHECVTLNESFKHEQKKTTDYKGVIDSFTKRLALASSSEFDLKRLNKELNENTSKRNVNDQFELQRQFEIQKSVVQNMQTQLDKTIQYLKTENDRFDAHKQSLLNTETDDRRLQRLTLEIDKLRETLTTTLQEKDDLTIRLSKLASASLTNNNPNIADLNDPNRPTKLAEAFSELYDNEWTDAFEKLKDDDEVKIVNSLLTMLQKAYRFSVSFSEHASDNIKEASTKFVFMISEKKNVNSNNSDSTTAKSLDDKTITAPDEKCENTITVETNSTHLPKIDFYDTDTKAISSQKNTSKDHAHYNEAKQHHEDVLVNESKTDPHYSRSSYAKVEKLRGHGNDKVVDHSECSSVTGSVKKVESEAEIATVTFNFEKLQPTEKQHISDIRRRILHNFKDQIISIISNAVVAEMNLHDCENSIFTYVKACASICWEMRIHQPPVCLEFVDVDDQTPFNTTTYKHYTNGGSRMDYAVWPALYLYEGGPLLSKGVAQGK
ncbi:uncharacterized protein LOC127880265 isoform X2 [Dreissena polymorpha]|uniref:uncharacterized protein LOC127880265 isoform X2 n=1 Tax=Dreissena polymorpha TaxID=45954 RepID=UPI002263EF79|nr:uncharacterized protein LOC127880265 isoform X2 [Dreissena polymorpha]